MMAGQFDIVVPRGAAFHARMNLKEQASGDPLDLTGWAIDHKVTAAAGGSTVATATISDRDDANGAFDILLLGSQFDAVDGDMEIVRLHHTLRLTDPDGVPFPVFRGALILQPGDA